jgi:2-dehydro-3-deoxygalactonokinase
VDAQGAVEAEIFSGKGALMTPPGGYEEALAAEVGEWISAGERKVLMCGMVGARRGWKEAPYLPLPAAFDQVVDGVIPVDADGLDARIVPGLTGFDECGVPEVMRGEETEIFGCAREFASGSRLCLPGTHSKWVRMEGGRVAAFTTCMTGDLYKAIREGTILRSGTQEEPIDDDSYLRGVARSKEAGGVAHHLFGARTLVLTGRMQPSSASSYLSGLLIGDEVKAMARTDESVHLIGDPALCALYARALAEFDVQSTVEAEGAALRGLLRIAGRLAW